MTDKNNIKVQFLDPNQLNGKIITIGFAGFKNVVENVKSLDQILNTNNFKKIMLDLFSRYFTTIYITEEQKIYFMHPKNYLDLFVRNGEWFWFRPVNFKANVVSCLQIWRQNVIRAIEITKYDENNEPSTNKKTRNIKNCNLTALLRRPPSHMRCQQSHQNCQHIVNFDKNIENFLTYVREDLRKEKKENKLICIHSLTWDLEETKESALVEMLDFQCLLNVNENFFLKLSKIFGRFDSLHGILCCPEILINEKFKFSLEGLLKKEKRKTVN